MRSAIANLAIALTIALLPVYNRIAAVDMNRTSKDNLFLILCGVFGVLLKDVKRDFPLKGWVAFALAVFLIVYNQYNVASINVMMYSFYATAGIFFFVRFYECFDKKFFDWILNGMCAGVIIQALFVLCNLAGISLEVEIAKLFNDKITVSGTIFNTFGMSPGSLGNPNLLGGYAALCSIAFLRPKWIYLAGFPVFVLFASGSAISGASVIAGLVYFFTRDLIHKKWFYLLASFSMFLAYFVGLGGLDNGRFEIWGMLFEKINLSEYFLGNGIGWYQDARFIWKDAIVVQEHSGFLTLFNTFGLLGAGVFAYFLYKYATKPETNALFSTVVFVAFCNAYAHFSIQQSTMMMIIILAVAISSAKEEDDEQCLEWRKLKG
jgi:hypothetical protein